MEKWIDSVLKGVAVAVCALVGLIGYVNADLAMMLASIAFAAVIAGLWE